HSLREDRAGRRLRGFDSVVRRARDWHLHLRQPAEVVSVLGVHSESRVGLALIILYKALKSLLGLAAGSALLTSWRQGGLPAVVHDIAQVLHIAPETVARHVTGRLAVGGALALLGLAVLDIVEATGLALRKRWAAWLTVIPTAALLPLELVHF